jgi:hypothetical protein
LSNEDAFKPEADAPMEKVFDPEDFLNNDVAERRAMRLVLLESDEAPAVAL